MGKLINRIPVSHLLISSLPGSALRISGSLAMSTSVLKALPGKLDIERNLSSIHCILPLILNCPHDPLQISGLKFWERSTV